MKVLYDHQAFSIQEYGGISRYFLELIQQFKTKKEMGVNFDISLLYSNNEYLRKYSYIKYHHFFSDTRFRGKGPFLNQINKLYSIPSLLKQDYDLFHPTYYNPYFLKYLKRKPFVVTVHDMIHELFPQYFPKYDRIRSYKRLMMKNASRIIAVSQNTKEDLLKIYDIDPEKIDVVYHGNPFYGCDYDANGENCLQDKYLLFVGNRQNYKNFNFFILSVTPILKNRPELKLICAGGGKFTRGEIRLLEKLTIQKQVIQVSADDEGLKKLYSNAIAFIFPSFYEGFGIPVLEAFSCGCPSILSNISSLPEIGGDAAIYFDPSDSNSLCSAILEVLDNENLRKNMSDAGLNRTMYFKWERAAYETKEVYNKIIAY